MSENIQELERRYKNITDKLENFPMPPRKKVDPNTSEVNTSGVFSESDSAALQKIIASVVTPLQKSIQDLTSTTAQLKNPVNSQVKTNEEIKDAITEQTDKLEHYSGIISMQQGEIDRLKNEVDDLKQQRFENEVVLTGHAATAICSKYPATRFSNNETNPALGEHIEKSLFGEKPEVRTTNLERIDVENKTAEENVNEESSESKNEDDVTMAASNKQLRTESANTVVIKSPPKIVSAFKVTNNKLGLVLRERNIKFEVFKKVRDISGLYAAERLIRTRDDLMYQLRELRKEHPYEKLAVFSRSGVPMVQAARHGVPTEIRNPHDIYEFKKLLRNNHPERSENFMDNPIYSASLGPTYVPPGTSGYGRPPQPHILLIRDSLALRLARSLTSQLQLAISLVKRSRIWWIFWWTQRT